MEKLNIYIMDILKITVALGLSEKEHKKINLLIASANKKGILTQEIIRGHLGRYMPGIITILSKCLNLSIIETHIKLSNGEITSDILPDLFKEYEKLLGIDTMKIEYDKLFGKNRLIEK